MTVSVQRTLKTSLELTFKNFIPLLPFVVAPGIVIGLFNFIMGSLISFLSENDKDTSSAILGVFWALTILPQLLFDGIFAAAEVKMLARMKAEEDWSYDECFKFGLNKCVEYSITKVCVAVTVAVGFLLLIVPGIIFTVWLFLAAIVVVLEDNQNGFSSLGRSRELVKGNAWQTVGILLVIVAVNVVLQGIVSAIQGSVSSHVLTMLVSVLVGLPVSFALSIWTLTVAIALYYECLSSEGTDEEAALVRDETPAPVAQEGEQT